MLFDEALHRDLAPFRANDPHITLLQYVDDLLLATETRKECERGTKASWLSWVSWGIGFQHGKHSCATLK